MTCPASADRRSTSGRKLTGDPEPCHGEMMVERERKPDARAFHNDETGSVDGRELVQVRSPEVRPGLFQVIPLTHDNLDGARLVDRVFPRQRRVAVGIPVEEGKRLDDYRQ